MGEEWNHVIDLGQRWAYASAKRHVDGDSEEEGGTGEDGFVIFAEDAPEDGSFAWTPYEGSASALVQQHNDLFDEWEALRYGEVRERAERYAEMLRERLPLFHRLTRRVAPGFRDDGLVSLSSRRHEAINEQHVCIGCQIEAALAADQPAEAGGEE